MAIVSRLVEIETDLPVDNTFIESELTKMNIYPIRWAIVKVDGNKLTINVSGENL